MLSSGKLYIQPMITQHLPLEEFEKGFGLLMSHPIKAGKIVLYPDSLILSHQDE
ncbi:hypothetical protein ACFL6I_08740 [candidate division KSB1 bacterium]